MSAQPRVVGEVVKRPLASVTKNSWNPNAMTDFEKASLKQGLLADGWLISQALLIWGTDEKGQVKNIIIDGEHRHVAATELGFVEGPMVFLENLPEAEAKALTVKMDAKRGKFDQDRLGDLLRELQFDITATDMSLGVGIPHEELMAMLAFKADVITPIDDAAAAYKSIVNAPAEQVLSTQAGHVRSVQLYFNATDFAAFQSAIKQIAAKVGTKDTSMTVLAAVIAASGS